MAAQVHMTRSHDSGSVIEIVIAEHRAVEQLYSEFLTSSDVEAKQHKLHWIIKLLSQHAGKEEMALYPVMRAKLPNGDALVKHAIAEHHQVKIDLARIDAMKVGVDQSLEADLAKTMQELMQHVKEEERDLLPALHKACTPQELIDIGKTYQQAEMIAPSHPHPSAPVGGVAGQLANIAAHAADVVHDKLKRPEVLKEDEKPMARETRSGSHPIL